MSEAVRRLLIWSSTPAGLGSLFLAGFAIRLLFAGGGGFPYDMSSFSAWAQRLAERGPWDFYPRPGEDFFVDYPPGYLYVLWGLGKLTNALGAGAPSVLWVKLPPILADLGLAWLVGELATRMAPARISRRYPIRGPAAAAILLNPAVFFISAVWGQADVILAVLVVGASLLLATGEPTFRREAGGIALLAVALGTKPQGAFALPMVVLFLVWRHVRSGYVEADVNERAGAIAAGIGRVAALAGVGAVAGLALLAPFRLGPVAAFDFYAKASSTYSVTSVFAFNGWGAVGFWRPDSGPDAFRVFGIPALACGLALFSLGGAFVLARAWQSLRSGEDEGRVLVFGCASITLVGFAVLTRVHERYLFLPMALVAVFVGARWLRRAFYAISALYLINTFFPYVYYLKYVGRPAPTLGGLFDAFYGTDTGGFRMRGLSALTAVACIAVAALGWKAITPSVEQEREEPVARLPESLTPVPKRPWTLQLHPVGTRGAVLAFIVFGIALLTRIPGLGHPPGMYFDEVYHARTGAEYLAKKEVFEWTHPPLAKELIAVSIDKLSAFGVTGGGELPKGVGTKALTSSKEGFFWVERTGRRGERSRVHPGTLDGRCALRGTQKGPGTALTPSAIATDGGPIFVTGTAEDRNEIVRLDAQGERWRASLAEPVRNIVSLGDRAFAVTSGGVFLSVTPEGEVRQLAQGADSIVAEADADPRRGESPTKDRVAEALPKPASRNGVVWVSFPEAGRVVAWDADGQEAFRINVDGAPKALAAPDRTERLVVSTGNVLTLIDSKRGEVEHRIEGGADLLASVPETEIAWAATGRQLRAIEPRSGVVIGKANLVREPVMLIGDGDGHRLVAVSGAGLECASGRPQFAWRLGSAVMGSAMIALVALLAMRLFGNLWLAGLAAGFLAVEGLAFTMSRIAIPESYTTAFLLAGWFCALSALYEWGSSDATRSRSAAMGWLVATGLFSGAAMSSKWVAVYGFAGILLLFVWDGIARGRSGVWGILGGPAESGVLLGLCLGMVPVLVYLATYVPFLSLGHSIGDLVRLQSQMFGYHANLDATHPFSSPWYGWPFGYKAVFLYLGGSGAERSEIWTIPNIVVFWGGLVGMGAIVRRALSTRAAALAVVVGAAIIQLAPWIAVGRVVFIYHYLPVVPFLAIALAWLLTNGLRESSYQKAVAGLVALGSIAFFVAVLPMLEGWSMPVSYLDAARRWLSWVIP